MTKVTNNLTSNDVVMYGKISQPELEQLNGIGLKTKI